ncbi:TetR family transcriptional regulator [Kitasatospora purpeofusca]|uniref:TetR/AcrR family transcriptional regulator n=1 Tax=Kitasatospora purpeofusca TaxID=67352 RepID=UPI0035D622E1
MMNSSGAAAGETVPGAVAGAASGVASGAVAEAAAGGEPVPRRGRRAGNSGAREQILAVARRRFLTEGYHAVTLRSVAAEAGVDLALVSYYFGSKKGLFGAALALTGNPAVLLAGALDGELETFPERALRLLLGVWDAPDSAGPLRAMIGGSALDPAVAQLVGEVVQREMVDLVAARLGGADARRRACLFGTQLAGLIMARYVLRLQPLAALPADEIARSYLPLLRQALWGRPGGPGGPARPVRPAAPGATGASAATGGRRASGRPR